MRNLRITKKRLGLSEPEDALLAAAEALLERMRRHVPPRFEAPRLLVLHASDHKTSNTLCLGDLVLEKLDPRFQVRTLSLRNGTIEDCRGCSFKICSHYANKGACFYGGSIAQEVLPAVRDCDALLLLPNYNDSVGANIMAFINRLTSLHVNNELSGRRLYAIVVSGYSGGELVATQAMGALCLNKSFLLPPCFCMLETSNDPGEILTQPGIRDRAAAFARRLEEEILSR
jgi:multimeric flavodoxin WrbA